VRQLEPNRRPASAGAEPEARVSCSKTGGGSANLPDSGPHLSLRNVPHLRNHILRLRNHILRLRNHILRLRNHILRLRNHILRLRNVAGEPLAEQQLSQLAHGLPTDDDGRISYDQFLSSFRVRIDSARAKGRIRVWASQYGRRCGRLPHMAGV
jgi:hypothetical protein